MMSYVSNDGASLQPQALYSTIDIVHIHDLILKLYFPKKKQKQKQNKNKSKARHYLHNNLKLKMVFLRCSFENPIINTLTVKYLFSFTFVYGIW